MTFQELGLCPQILSALRALGYEKPSPIQEKAIPPALKGRDVLGCAQTGTGKTCAFATPILQQLHNRPVKGRPIRALILTPTRELALQIQESFELYGKNLPLRSAVIFGGVGQQPQVDKLKAGVDILVATPGRLEDLHNQGYIHVENLEIFVLDEADRMLDMGFIHDVKKILKWIPQKKQTLFFSATMPPEVQHLVDSLLVNPVKVAVDPVSSPVEVIDQRLFYVDRGNKSKLLAMLVKHPDVKNALVFTRTKHGANKVAGDLTKAGVPSAAIHGNKSQTARQQALADFKAGRVKALVATDIAARGLDIEELSHVFNYNLPDVPETYVHRIGRTGRAGRGGTAVSFCEFGEKELLGPIEKLLKKPIPVVEGHPFPMEVFETPKRDKHGKIVNADDQEARQAARERKKQREEGKKANPIRTPKPAPKQVKHPEPAEESPILKDMDPRRRAEYEAWLAQEREIQKKYYRDALEGDEIMDATARLLAPKGSVPPQKPAAVPQPKSQQPKSQQPKPQPKQPQPRREEKPQKQSKQQKPPKTKPAQKAVAPKPHGSSLDDLSGRSAKPNDGPRQAIGHPKPQGKQVQPPKAKAPVPQKQPRATRRGPVEAPRSIAQKDSTEQQSLMKPYYFNPNED